MVQSIELWRVRGRPIALAALAILGYAFAAIGFAAVFPVIDWNSSVAGPMLGVTMGSLIRSYRDRRSWFVAARDAAIALASLVVFVSALMVLGPIIRSSPVADWSVPITIAGCVSIGASVLLSQPSVGARRRSALAIGSFMALFGGLVAVTSGGGWVILGGVLIPIGVVGLFTEYAVREFGQAPGG